MGKLSTLAVSFVLIASLLLAGCGGGSSGASGDNNGNNPAGPQSVTGVAATGSPLSGTVYLKDSANPAKELSKAINSDGSFTFDVTGLTAPFILKAVGTANGQNYTLYSCAGLPGIANINPLSHLAVVQANGGFDPTSLYAAPTLAQMQAIKTAMVTIIPQIQALLQQILSQYGVTTTNFVSDAYVANHLGLDLLFDLISIQVSNGNLIMANKISGTAILAATLGSNTLTGNIVMANLPAISAPSSGAVYVYPSVSLVAPSMAITFKAIVMGMNDQSVTWNVVEAGGGSITSAGIYTAPAVAGVYHVQATSVVNAANKASATVTVSSAGGSISGVVTSGGSALAGVRIALTGSSSAATTTSAAGTYAFPGLANGNYVLSASLSGYTFSPSISVTVNSGIVTGQNFVGNNVLTTGTIVSSWIISGSSGANMAAGTIQFLPSGILSYSVTETGISTVETGTGTWALAGSKLTIIYDKGAIYTGTAAGTSANFTMVSTNGWTMNFLRIP
jgi:hypothetical protein